MFMGRQTTRILIKPANQICLDSPFSRSANGPRAQTLQAHTHHPAGSAGNECIGCHMPKIEQTVADVNVRSHTFRFISPAMTDRYKIPNPCTDCHKDKSTAWALQQLKGWSTVSPWRVEQ